MGEVRAVSGMHQRKAEMARQADAFIALPGAPFFFYIFIYLIIRLPFVVLKFKCAIIFPCGWLSFTCPFICTLASLLLSLYNTFFFFFFPIIFKGFLSLY